MACQHTTKKIQKKSILMRANALALLALLMRQSGLFISLDFPIKIFCAFVFHIFEALNL